MGGCKTQTADCRLQTDTCTFIFYRPQIKKSVLDANRQQTIDSNEILYQKKNTFYNHPYREMGNLPIIYLIIRKKFPMGIIILIISKKTLIAFAVLLFCWLLKSSDKNS